VEELGEKREMKTLPSGVTVFNATPHPIRFWEEGWDAPIEVGVDAIISASVEEMEMDEVEVVLDKSRAYGVRYVSTKFSPTDEGWDILEQAFQDGADVIVGSIVAAQAYPGWVVAMTPAPGYERVPPAEKRMRPDKFTIF